MNHVSLFAGMGGFVVGMENAGFETLLCNDFEPACVRTLESLCSEEKVDGRSIDDPSLWESAKDLGVVDVLSGGFPCQPFSVAGEKQGFNDLERGSKFFDMMSFVDALEEPPKILFLENVPNLKTYNGGQWLFDILTALKMRGYWVAQRHCQILNSRTIAGGVQNRERLFVVAYHEDFFRANYFKVSELPTLTGGPTLWEFIDRSVKEADRLYLDPENKHYKMLNKAMSENGVDRLYQVRRASVRANPIGVCPTLTANMGGGGHNVPFLKDDFGIRRLSVSECLLIQGFPADYQFPEGLSDSAKLKMIGNSVDPRVIEVISKQLAKDLNERNNLGVSL